MTPRCAERQSLAFCLAPAEPLAGLEETRQVWEREKAELNESIARSVQPAVAVTALVVHDFRACLGTLLAFFVADSLWSLNSAHRRLEASSKELQERTLEVAALGRRGGTR